MGKICSSEEGRFRRADKAFGYLQHSFFSGLLRKKFHARNGAEKAKSPLLSGAVPTIQSLTATNSAAKVFWILFTAQDAAQIGHVYKRTPAPTKKLTIGNVSKSPTPKVRRNSYVTTTTTTTTFLTRVILK